MELDPKNAAYPNTLGVAFYRAAAWQAAIDALTKSMELRSGGDSFDWYFLAMAHGQLDNMEEARKWFDQADAWMKTNQPQNEELQRFRAEAAALLGVKEENNGEVNSAPKNSNSSPLSPAPGERVHIA